MTAACFTNEKVVNVKVFLVFVLLAVLNVGVVILMDIIQSIPLYNIAGVLGLPWRLIGGQEGVLLFLFIPLVIVCHRRIMKNSNEKTG